MDFNVKKLVKEAGTALSRVVQLTEEKLGTSEKTELDAQFESLAERSDLTKQWTERLVKNTESVLTPNPGNRVEDFIFEKIEKKKPNRLSNLEYLGLDMIEAGNEFGQSTPYGSALIKVGGTQQKLGQFERDMIGSAGLCYIQPLRKFLDGEMKTVLKERGILESKRLDLDACKNRVRKARSMIGQQSEGITPELMLEQAERDLRIAQSEFDRQAEITKLLLEGVASSGAAHLRHLQELVATQVRHYAQCHRVMQDLQKELVALGGPSPYTPVNTNEAMDSPPSSPQSQKARILFDYDAKDSTELSLIADEIVSVWECMIPDVDYMIGERGLQRGRVPKAYLEILQS
ncbi:SH3 domain containing GRB2 like, endophilin-B isoform X2 [Arctopsyche grandis]|uniref:SH3 domain containing GRB2 like, endophilin-B isoform X2 n=1 Tax=Arctopsyche grandis TaxID=121162 RepID=UPI00406D9BB3